MGKLLLIISFVICLQNIFVGQSFTLKANKDSILVGEPIELTLSANNSLQDSIIWPMFAKGDSLPQGFEVLQVLPKQKSNNQKGVEMQQLVVTSFYPDSYTLKPFVIQQKDKVITSNALSIHVSLVPLVDTLQPFKPLKPIKTPVISFSDRLGEMWNWVKANWYIPLAILIVLVLLIWLLIRYRKNKSLPEVEEIKPVVKVVAHEKAYKDFEQLKALNLLEKQEYKQHYVILSEILNQYLANKYSVSTQDKTSDEVLKLVKNSINNNEQFNSLKTIFTTADLVKFAKQIPTNDVNEALFNQSVQFVKDTTN